MFLPAGTNEFPHALELNNNFLKYLFLCRLFFFSQLEMGRASFGFTHLCIENHCRSKTSLITFSFEKGVQNKRARIKMQSKKQSTFHVPPTEGQNFFFLSKDYKRCQNKKNTHLVIKAVEHLGNQHQRTKENLKHDTTI